MKVPEGCEAPTKGSKRFPGSDPVGSKVPSKGSSKSEFPAKVPEGGSKYRSGFGRFESSK